MPVWSSATHLCLQAAVASEGQHSQKRCEDYAQAYRIRVGKRIQFSALCKYVDLVKPYCESHAYQKITFSRDRRRQSSCRVPNTLFDRLWTFSLLPFTAMDPTNTLTEKTVERRQLRDVAGNLVYRDKDDNRIFLSHIAEYTAWDEKKMFLTFPLFLWRVYRLPYQWTKHNIWIAPDPTIVVPSGKKNPLYWPKYEDEPRPEPE